MCFIVFSWPRHVVPGLGGYIFIPSQTGEERGQKLMLFLLSIVWIVSYVWNILIVSYQVEYLDFL